MDRWCGGFEEPQEDWYGHCRGWVGGEEELGDQAHEEEETARGSGLKRYKRTLARADAEGKLEEEGKAKLKQCGLIIPQVIEHDCNDPAASFPSFVSLVANLKTRQFQNDIQVFGRI